MSGAPIELERRFLVRSSEWRKAGHALPIIQGYLSTDRNRVVRVRIVGERAWLTVKGAPDRSGARVEIEGEIPSGTARTILSHPQLCIGTIIEKTRTRVRTGSLEWEVDEFDGRNAGLRIAEIEYNGTMTQAEWHKRVEAERPPWLGDEVTARHEFANAALTEQPFDTWSEEARAAIMGGSLPG